MHTAHCRGRARHAGAAILIFLLLAAISIQSKTQPPPKGEASADTPQGTGPLVSPAVLRLQNLGPSNLVVPLEKYQHIRYVSPHTEKWAVTTGDPGAPWSSIPEALARITDAGPKKRYALIIAAATYRVHRLSLKPYVDLYGGFAPGRWWRDIEKCPTVLEGGQKGPMVFGADNARLDGFILRGGRSGEHGGAMVCRDVSPWISNNIFNANTTAVGRGGDGQVHGGAIACIGRRAQPLIENNVIAFNSTLDGDGGAIALLEGAGARIQDNVLAGNVAGVTPGAEADYARGGAIACVSGGDLELTGNLVINNMALGDSNGGGVYVGGAGRVRMQRNVFAGNNATASGGGLYAGALGDLTLSANILAANTAGLLGGGAFLAQRCSGNIENTLLSNNRALAGGGLAVDGAIVTMGFNTISANHATEQGGGVFVNTTGDRPPALLNSVVSHNDPNDIGAAGENALRLRDCVTAEGWGRAVAADPLLAGDNYSGSVATMEFDPATFQTRMVIVARQIFTPALLKGRVIGIGVKCSIIADNQPLDEDDHQEIRVWGDMTGGGMNRPPVSFNILPTYRPLADSPCIDAAGKGGPGEDLYGNARSERGGKRALADIGAVEFIPPAPLLPALAKR